MSHCPLNSTDNPPISYVFVEPFLDAGYGDYSQAALSFPQLKNYMFFLTLHVLLSK